MMGRGFSKVIASVLLLAATSVHALDQRGLRQAVEGFMQTQTKALLDRYGRDSRIEFSVTEIDPRLNVTDCPQALTMTLKTQANLSSRQSVEVRCNHSNGWSVFVPVDIAIFKPVVSVTSTLPVNSTIRPGDVQLVETDITRLNGRYITVIDEVVGMSAKRTLIAGSAVNLDQLAQPILIKRGEAVTIVAEVDGLSVHMPGVALADGRRGEPIRVKNSNSARIVDAQVISEGVVGVSM